MHIGSHPPYPQLCPDDESALSRLATATPAAPVILEIGSWTGHSTTILGRIAKAKGGRVVVVDPFTGEAAEQLREFAENNDVRALFDQNIREAGVDDIVTVFQMRSDDAVALIPDGSVDLIFLDGDHHYLQVSRDIQNYRSKLKPGGVFAGHDLDCQTDEPGSIDPVALETECCKGVHWGVTKAVAEEFGPVQIEGAVWWVTP